MMSPRFLLALAASLGAVALIGCPPRAAESPRTTTLDVDSTSHGPQTDSVEPEPTEERGEEPVTEPSADEADADPADDAPPDPPEASVASTPIASMADAGTPDASVPDAGRAARPAPAACTAETWGGWAGDAQCRAASGRRSPGAPPRSETDADCVIVREGCHPHAVHRRHAARYHRWTGPCTGPGAGACAGPGEAVCDQGCCVASHGFGGGRGPPSLR